MLRPPDTNPYNVLKEILIKRTAASEQRRVQQLFQAEELGGRKPTQLLRVTELLSKKPSSGSCSCNVRMVLATSPIATPLESLAELANRVIEITAHPMATISPSTTPSVPPASQPSQATPVTAVGAHQPTSARASAGS